MNEDIEKYASLALDDENYIYFINQIINKKYNKARLFIEECIDKTEMMIILGNKENIHVLSKQLNLLFPLY